MSQPGTAPTTGMPPAKRPRRWLLVLLLASLAFNLVIVGAAVAERFWPQASERASAPRSTDLLPYRFFAELDRQRRAELRAVFRAHRAAFHEERQELRQAARAVAAALGETPYDPEKVRSAIAEHVSRSHKLVDLAGTVAGEVIDKLTPDERRLLADRIRERAEPRQRTRSEPRRSRKKD